MIKKFLLAGLIILFGFGLAHAQPFGIAMGTNPHSLKIITTVNPYKFIVEPPKRHPSIKTVMVLTAPKIGVCYISAKSYPYPADASGEEIRLKFDELREQIGSVYGESEMISKLGGVELNLRSQKIGLGR
jgi:hypothetical protein